MSSIEAFLILHFMLGKNNSDLIIDEFDISRGNIFAKFWF